MTTAISAVFAETGTHHESIVKVIKKAKLSITNKKQENLSDPVCTRNVCNAKAQKRREKNKLHAGQSEKGCHYNPQKQPSGK